MGISRFHVRVEFHTTGEHTHVRWLGAPGMAERDRFEIPTGMIPTDLRPIGSEFLLVMQSMVPVGTESPEEIRRLVAERNWIERLQP